MTQAIATKTTGKAKAKTKAVQAGNAGDKEYAAFLRRLQACFALNLTRGPLFTTNVAGLWETYIETFPAKTRQYHTCNACRRFIEHFGGLVTIDEEGTIVPAMWDVADADPEEVDAVKAMSKAIMRAKVDGVFLSSAPVWGLPKTDDWIHLHVQQQAVHVFKKLTLTAGQAMAEKLEDFKNVKRALEEFTPPMLAQALTLLNSDALYRAEKVIGPAQWLADLHERIAKARLARGVRRADNVLWRAVALAPAGFCHPRSSMIGTLLEDIAADMLFADIERRFRAKMSPLQYQRPQAAPTAGNIAQAEKLVEKMGIARSLERRFARLHEIDAVWREASPEPVKSGGVFANLKPKGSEPANAVDVPLQTMTWEKFARTMLPTAKAIDLYVPIQGNFHALVTAVHPDAPPILQWDTEERRNPFSWYVYPEGSRAADWHLRPGAWTPVPAITALPPAWFGGTSSHHGEGAIFILEGARDLRRVGGAGLFPECLKTELHSVRATIEAHSRGTTVAGSEEASACGIGLRSGRGAENLRLRVTDRSGARIEVRLDRWD